MSIRIQINNSDDPKADYITWAPAACRIISDEATHRTIVLNNLGSHVGGKVVFMNAAADSPEDSLKIELPANGSISFFIAGKYNHQKGKGFASKKDKDATIAIKDATTGTQIGKKSLMVRIRKNANKLTKKERDNYLDALVKLNQSGKYVELQNMHLSTNSNEIHGRSCFLAWHRAFLLDLERKLQEITPSVTIPYWKFDEKAQHVFIRDFLGVPDTTGMVDFSNTNPLINWRLSLFGQGSGTRVRRSYTSLLGNSWNPLTHGAVEVQNNENQTLHLGTEYVLFADLESDPHGSAHISFNGQISNIGTAPADPLFFLLHANIDRLWAKWQWTNKRYDGSTTDSYPNQGNGNPLTGGSNGIGNFTNDTMWPWNRITGFPRPPAAPGNGFPDSPISSFPGKEPKVSNVIDFQGQIHLSNCLQFAYDDVPYEIPVA